ncbi:uncharacterized protein SOCE26_037640 [Sorangium cellulosum]|uniref:Uncharacterized protein n=1 Tax=Sorangium cellulosum TaxID=56 RepID=A0A2L0ESS4_SORCE|nr:hypothetical protein [Sorangium cellulosum]AUX42334.1 uncharacterized protein SOCE26_037640 [Sorangium cellulosum]
MTPRVTPTPAPAAVRRVLLLCGAAAFCAGVVRLNERRAPWSADEVDLASLAVAMLHRGAAWIRPTYHPLDPDAFVRLGDGIIAPPLASALMAVPGLLGVRLPGAWPVVGALLLVAGIAAVVRAVTPQRWTLVLLGVAATLALAPGLVLDLLKLEAEIPLTGFGLLGLALALDPRARGAPFRFRPALSGGGAAGPASERPWPATAPEVRRLRPSLPRVLVYSTRMTQCAARV